MDLFFDSFAKEKAADFRRIAARTKGEMTAGDLLNEAWLIALEIAEKRGRYVDFSDPDEQNLVLSWLRVKFVWRGDWAYRTAFRLDGSFDGDENAEKWIERLPADALSEPQNQLELWEAIEADEHALASSYSQAAAYLIVFAHFDDDRRLAAIYLFVTCGTLDRRFNRAVETVRTQHSLFDGIETVDDAFMALPGRQYIKRIEQFEMISQPAFEF